MASLTSKQKSHLRGLGQKLQCTSMVGKAGVTDALLASISRALEQHELVKVRIPAGSGDERQAMAERLAEQTRAECAGVVGRTALLYRPNPNLPAKSQIELP